MSCGKALYVVSDFNSCRHPLICMTSVLQRVVKLQLYYKPDKLHTTEFITYTRGGYVNRHQGIY